MAEKKPIKPECEKCGYYNPEEDFPKYRCYTRSCPVYRSSKVTPEKSKRLVYNQIHLFLSNAMSSFPHLAKNLKENPGNKTDCIAFLRVLTGGSRKIVVEAIDDWIEKKGKP